MEDNKKEILNDFVKDDKLKQPFAMADAMNINLHNGYSFNDDLHLYKANIYKCLGATDDRLQVRPLPYFTNIEASEEENLPIYPCMEKGRVITGMSEKEDGIENCEKVWIAATADFQIGYVLFKANVFGQNKTSPKFTLSYAYSTLKSYLDQRTVCPKDFNYSHLDVIKWYATDDGGAILAMNSHTGDLFYLNSSGTCLSCQQKKIFMRVGTPPDPLSAGPVAYSALTMTPDKTLFKCPNFEIDAQDIVFGHKGMYLSATPSVTPCLGTNGISTVQDSHIHV